MMTPGVTAREITTQFRVTTPAWPRGPQCSGRMVTGRGSGAPTWRWGTSRLLTGITKNFRFDGTGTTQSDCSLNALWAEKMTIECFWQTCAGHTNWRIDTQDICKTLSSCRRHKLKFWNKRKPFMSELESSFRSLIDMYFKTNQF